MGDDPIATINPDDNRLQADKVSAERQEVLQESAEAAVTLANEAAPVLSDDVKSFYQRYNLAMKAWYKEKGNTNFPIAEVKQADGSMKLVWVNRAQRAQIRRGRKS